MSSMILDSNNSRKRMNSTHSENLNQHQSSSSNKRLVNNNNSSSSLQKIQSINRLHSP